MFTRQFTVKPIASFLLILFCLFAFTGLSYADQVTLSWDANAASPDGYHVYQRAEGSAFNYSTPVWSGSSTSCTINDLVGGTTYYYIVRAFMGTEESGDSNEVSYLAVEQTPVTHTINAASGANGTVSPSGTVSVTDGGSQSYTISANTGYQVSNVVVDGASVGAVSSYTFSNVNADHTISATFTANSYTITASASGNGTISPSDSRSVAYGGSQTYAISANIGYHVSNVVVDSVSIGAVSSYTFSSVSANHTISASFAVNSYTITASAGSNGIISPSGSRSVAYGGSLTYAISANTGYHVSNVVVDGASAGAVSSYTFNSVNANHTISASFAVNSYTITSSASSNGTISPSGNRSVAYGGSQTYTISANDGYSIADVKVDNTSVGSVASYTFSQVSGNHTITASFRTANQAPAADAGPDQTVDEAQQVTLNGQNSIDMDDGIAAFQWRQIMGPTVSLINANEPEAAFTAPNVDDQGEVLEFELTVTDFSGATSTDRCIVNVTWVNITPAAQTSGDQIVQSGMEVMLDATQSVDPDGGVLFYEWTQRQGPTVTLSDNHIAQPRFTAPDTDIQGVSLIFDLTVTDEGGLQDTDSCVITVTWVNAPPVAKAGSDQSVVEGDAVTLSGEGSSDPDDGIKSYLWRQTEGTPVTLSDSTAIRPVFTAPQVGVDGETLRFQLVVTDNNGLQSADNCQVLVQDSDPAPVQDTIPPTVTITEPISSGMLILKAPKATFRGTARDDQQLDRIEWSNQYGDNGLASGTNAWEIVDLKLRRGLNMITITAYDMAGNHASASILVYAGLFR